ncbi:hypothetical protein QML40_11075, partial [Aerococcus urinaeequi]
QQFSQNAYKFGQAELLCRKGKWFLHVSASKEIDSPDETNIQRIVGIDRGLRQILTIADDTKIQYNLQLHTKDLVVFLFFQIIQRPSYDQRMIP